LAESSTTIPNISLSPDFAEVLLINHFIRPTEWVKNTLLIKGSVKL
jgi:hypothetical protein